MNKLGTLLNVETGEGRLVGALFLHSFFLGVANNFVQTAAFALFMIEFNAQKLALVYVANALLLPVLTFLYLRLGSRLSFSKLLATNLGFLFILISAFRLGMGLSNASWLVFALPILFQILVNFGNLEFWTLAGRLFNVRQAKRLFGLIGAGQWLAIVITGLLIPLLVRWLGTVNLLFISSAAVACALGLLVYITRVFSHQLATTVEDASTQEKSPFGNLLKNRYVILIFILVVLWWLAFFYLDNIFYDRAAIQYPDSEQLASFLGIFLAGLGVVTLFNNTLLSGLIVGRFGVRTSLLILPLVLAVSATLMALFGTLGAALTFLFWLTVIAKLLDMSIGFSIDRSALTILYQPLPLDQRGQAQTMAEGIFQPLSNGLAGLSLLALGALFSGDRLPLMYVLVFVVLAWLVIAILLGRQYPSMLMQALTRRRLGQTDLLLSDRASLEVLQQGLQNTHPGVVIYTLNQLETIGQGALSERLKDLLEHPAPEVRQEALKRIERLGLVEILPAIERRIETEPSPVVRSEAVRSLAVLGEDQTFEKVSVLLDDSDAMIRRGAMVGMLRSGGIAGVLAAGQKLLEMVTSPQVEERLLATQVLSEAGIQNYYQPLITLLMDENERVQRAALLAAVRVHNPKLWPLVLKKLEQPSLHGPAAAALVAGGEGVLPDIISAFNRPGQSQDVQVQLVRICGRIGGDRSIAWLKELMAHPDRNIRTQVFQALDRCDYQAVAEETDLVSQGIQAELALSAETLAILMDLDDTEATGLLRSALLAMLEHDRRRIFFLLSFLYDRDAILSARDNLGLASAEKRAYALEVLDVLIHQNLKRTIFPLLEDITVDQKAKQMATLFPEVNSLVTSSQQRLREIITGPSGQFSPWTRACALHAASHLADPELKQCVISSLTAPEPLVRESAIWALSRLDRAQARIQCQTLSHDPNPVVIRAIIQLEKDQPEELMLSTLEKVIALKKVSIFAETPDEVLAEVASLLEEVYLDDGQMIFEKGDVGDCMYIIVDGEVRVHDGERTLNHLYSGDVFGESAVLDSEPRMASITAVSETQLLRLAQEPFYEVMESRSEVARGVIRVLSSHLRQRLKDLNELRAAQEILQ
jgi:AAA family ATP:ADP antiporter